MFSPDVTAPPLPPGPGQRPRAERGFSLVEVVLALGIVGFALVALFGMLPFGLNVFRQAIDKTVGAQIAQEMTNMVQRTPFGSLSGLGSARSAEVPGTTATFYYYDVEGTLLGTVPSATGGTSARPLSARPINGVYRVQVYAAPDAELGRLLGVGGAGGALWRTPLTNVKAMHIDIRNLSLTAEEEQKLITYVANSGF